MCCVEQVYGSGNQTRSFQYVSDLVDGLIALMNSNYSLPVNIGNPQEYSVAEFAQFIKDIVGTLNSLWILNCYQMFDPFTWMITG